MDSLIEGLTKTERADPLWIKITSYLEERKHGLISKLIIANDDVIRGRIREIEFLLKGEPPGNKPTRHM
jgi:hypothetical protein